MSRVERTRGAVMLLAVAVAALLLVAPANASRAPDAGEKRAIERAFLKSRDGKATVKSIRVSTEDPRYAAVTYEARIPAVKSRALPKKMPAPTPDVLKEKKKWKPVTKVPKKVKKDLGAKAKSDIRISGDVSAHLTRGAACSHDREYYGAGIYNPGTDVYLSLQFPSWSGYGAYEARGVHSLAALSVGNSGGEPQYETGQGYDAFEPSGAIYVDEDGWGIIEAGMAAQPDESGTKPISVDVSGYWVCR